MADEQDIDMSEPKSSGNKRLLLIIGIVILVSMISVGATMFLLMGDEEKPVEEAPVEEVKLPALYLEIDPAFVVTYKVGSRQRYMQVYVTLMVRDQGLFDALKTNAPAVKSGLLNVFNSQDFNYLKTPEGKDELRQLALAEVNKIVESNIGEGTVEQVLFTNIVMQ